MTMSAEVFRYRFGTNAPIEEVEASLLLAVLAAENLHGEAVVRLDARHRFDAEARECVIDGASPAGLDLNKLFAGFLSREFGAGSFTVDRLAAYPEEMAAGATA
jgi:hypothetical protein